MRSIMAFPSSRAAVIDGLPLVDLFADRFGLQAKMGPDLVGNFIVSQDIARSGDLQLYLQTRGGFLILFPIASCRTMRRTFAEYALLAADPPSCAQPGSLQYGSSHMIRLWIEMST